VKSTSRLGSGIANIVSVVSLTTPLLVILPVGGASATQPRGVVYTMTNSTTGNQVLAFNRDNTGRLGTPVAFSTGGTGTGTGLGNQNGLVIDESTSCLFAVNAGSDHISSFAIKPDSLQLADKISSGGLRPVSIAVNNGLVYVLNAGGARGGKDNISGFRVDKNCKLSPLASSTRPLSAANTAPAQVQFTPDGKWLVVTEKATNKIDTYQVLSSGRTVGPKVQTSAGTTPFGFSFGKRNQLFVSEAVGGTPDAGTISSYKITPTGQLQVISSTIATTETAICWVVTSNDGRFIYVTNTGSQSVSTFNVGFFGSLSLLNPNLGGRNGVTGTGTAPIDLVLSVDNTNLYALDNAKGTIINFAVNPATGGINRTQIVTGLPGGSNGLATR
jgi:6-phosphogluconolactonase (cycloisomerase 2 family)